MTPPRALLIALALVLGAWAALAPLAAEARHPPPSLVLPVTEGRILELARIPEPNWHPGHRGIDVAADAGAAVVAPGAGRVAFAGDVAGQPTVAVELDIGLRATLQPVTASVAVGTRVRRGEAIGVLADVPGHCAPRGCVHWGLKLDDRYLDPLDWLAGYGRIVLLPGA